MSPLRAAELKQVLEQEIVTGVLEPGARLDEMSLASRFNVSRTPVREALRELSSIGLVDLRPRRGAVVATVGLKDLVDMFEVMAEMEGMCGRLAARRMNEAERAELERVHAAAQPVVEQGDPDAYYRINVQFHEIIYRGSHNRFLAQQTMALRNRLAPYRRLQLHQRDRLGDSYAEHDAVLQAIAERDQDRVDALLQAHVTVQSGSFADFIASLPADLMGQTG